MRSLRDISPTLAQAFTEIRSDYVAATQTRYRRRRTGIPVSGAGADYHYRSETDYLRIMEYARDFDRNDPIVGQGVTRLVNNVLQDGLRLHPLTGDDALNDDLREHWNTWCEDPNLCDIRGKMTFHKQAALVLRSCIFDGDIFTLPIQGGTLQHIEAHRVRTPRSTTKNVVGGILLDDLRKPIEYWVCNDNISPMQQSIRMSDIKRYKARDADGVKQVFHTFFPKRFSQERGISTLAPIFDPIGMHDDTQFAHMVAAQAASCFAIIRTKPTEFTGAATSAKKGDEVEETLSGGQTRTIQGIAPGMEIEGRPGETITGFSPSIPNPEWFPHQMMILTIIAVNLHLPVAVLLLDPSNTNFSGWRGAIDQARIGFKDIQRDLASEFHRQVYLWKLREWMMTDTALRNAAKKQGLKIARHRWNSPTWPYIEPEKDVKTDSIRLDYCLTSPRRLHAERGNEWSEIIEEAVQDNAMAVVKAKKEAMRINATFKDADPVGWRELIFLPGSTTGADNKPAPPEPAPVTTTGSPKRSPR